MCVCVSERMIHLEIDLADTTLNPLHVPSKHTEETNEATASSSSTNDDRADLQKRVREYLYYVARFLLFLVPPIVGIWGWDNDAQVRPHMLSWTYVNIVYLVVIHVSTRRRIANGGEKVILGLVVGLYVLVCVVGLSLKDTNISIPSQAHKTARCECTGCEYLAKTDLPTAIHYHGLFPHGQDEVMAIGGESTEGKARLSLAAVKQSAGLVGLVTSRLQPLLTMCEGIVGAVVFGSFVGPCDETCNMKKQSVKVCLQAMQNMTCLAHMQAFRDSSLRLRAQIDKILNIPFLPNAADDYLFKDILRHRSDTLDTAFARFTNGTAFCTTPDFFDVDPEPLFNCTVDKTVNTGRDEDSVRVVLSTTLVAHIGWSVLAIAHCAVTAVHTHTVTEEQRSPKYHIVDRVLLVCSIAFLAVLSVLLFLCLRKLDPGTTVPSPWEHIVGQTIGALLTATTTMAWTTCLSLRRRRQQYFEAKGTCAVFKWYRVFQTMVDMDDGMYYFHYAIACETMEIVLQFSTLNTMARTNDVQYVMTSTTILCVNLVATPLAHLSSFRSDTIGRKATYALDTLLESAYVFLNLTVARRADLLNVPVLLSLLMPLVTLLFKFHTFVESTTTYLENKARRDSWLATMWTLSIKGIKDHVPQPQSQQLRKPTIALCLCGGAMALSGCVLFAYMALAVHLVDEECGRLLGPEVWAGASPRRIFQDGIFFWPKCHFTSVVTVEARQKGVTTLTPHIGDLVNLTRIVLVDNDIKSLPKEFATLQNLNEVDLSGNPVWTRVSWRHQEFQTFPAVLFKFPALEVLDLGYNDISTIPETIVYLSELRVAIFENNSIHRQGLPMAMLSLPRLERLEVRGNPVARTLSWHNMSPKELARMLVFWKDTLEDLDVSKGSLMTKDTRSLLEVVPNLIRLNVSENRLTSVEFDARSLRRIKMLDVSRNPVTSLSLDTFVAMDTVWKREGVVRMTALKATVLGIDLQHESPLLVFPHDPIEHFLKHNVDIFSVFFYGTGKEIFPVCSISQSARSVLIHKALEINTVCLSRCTQMVFLNLAMTNLNTIDVSSLTQLSELYLDHNKLETIDVTSLTRLTTLRVDSNELKTINVSPLTALMELHLDRNRLKKTNVSSLTQLKKLYLSDNELRSIDLKPLTQLKVLTLGNNSLKTIDVSPSTHLTHLKLQNNNLTTIDLTPLTKLRFLRLDGNHFNTPVPTAVSNNTYLRCLNLRNNLFLGGMEWLQNMTELRWLDLRHNTFQGHMPEIHSLASLEFLGLGSSGFVYNESYILSKWPKLEKRGDHFRSKDVNFDVWGSPKSCLG